MVCLVGRRRLSCEQEGIEEDCHIFEGVEALLHASGLKRDDVWLMGASWEHLDTYCHHTQ